MNDDDLTEKALPTCTTAPPAPAAAERLCEPPASPPPPPPLAALLDVAAVDAYLLQTFVAPKLAALLRQQLTTFTSSSTNRTDEKYERLIYLVALPFVQIVTLLHTRGQTPAVRMLGLKLAPTALPPTTSYNNRKSHHPRPPGLNDGQSTGCPQLLLYACLRFIVPVLYQLFQKWLVAQENKLTALLLLQQQQQDSSNDDFVSENHQQQQQERTALLRQCRISQAVVIATDRTWPVVQLMALLSCWSATSSSRTTITTPDVALRLAGLTHRSRKTTAHAPPQLHVTYAHRRWLYEQGFETIQRLAAGLLPARAVWSPVVRHTLVDPAVRFWRRSYQKRRATTTTTSMCPICRHYISTATTVAVRADCCGHVYCYTCLYYDQITAAACASPQRWYRCSACGQHIGSATPVSQ